MLNLRFQNFVHLKQPSLFEKRYYFASSLQPNQSIARLKVPLVAILYFQIVIIIMMMVMIVIDFFCNFNFDFVIVKSSPRSCREKHKLCVHK